MNSDDLTREQARAIKNKVTPVLDYFVRLHKRMSRRGFPADDPLKIAVANAVAAVHDLHAEVLCRSIEGKGRNENSTPLDLLFTRTSKPRKHEWH